MDLTPEGEGYKAVLEADRPNFIAAVERSREEKAQLVLQLAAFWGEGDMLFHALAYARERDVTVVFVP